MNTEECRHDTRKLFQLVNHLTGCKPDTPLPARDTEQELANEFADFFIQKLIKIRDKLDDYPTYQPSNLNVPKFNSFKEISQDQVRKIIISTKSKSCELDPIPTTLLKNILPIVLPAITKIINLSLQCGLFPRK